LWGRDEPAYSSGTEKAALVAQGLTNKEIAQRLGLSVFTVRNQVKVIMRKLELKNRVQVAYLFGRR
jgi:DNA-binding NarL/FixJ family response regulator